MSAAWLLLVPVAILAYTHLLAAAGWAFQKAEAGGQFGIEARILALIAREGVARALFRSLSPLGWGRARLRPVAIRGVGEKPLPPLLLVPGIHFNRASLRFLVIFLRHRGWRWVWPLHRPRGRGVTLAGHAAHVSAAVRELRDATGAAQVDVVAFSSGGLAVAWGLRHDPELAGQVRRVVTLATPWQGTKLAVFGQSASHREVRYGSPVIEGLWPEESDVVCIWSPDDPVVVPADSAAPPAGDDATDVSIESAGHVELLISARAFRAVQAALERP